MYEEFEENVKLYGFLFFVLWLEYLKFVVGFYKVLIFDEVFFYISIKILVLYVCLLGIVW